MSDTQRALKTILKELLCRSRRLYFFDELAVDQNRCYSCVRYFQVLNLLCALRRYVFSVKLRCARNSWLSTLFLFIFSFCNSNFGFPHPLVTMVLQLFPFQFRLNHFMIHFHVNFAIRSILHIPVLRPPLWTRIMQFR